MKRMLKVFLWTIAFVVFASESLVFYYSRNPLQEQTFDYILLLGVTGRQTSELMIDRAKLAVEAAKLWPDAKVIITGNESLGEISSLRSLVLASGVAPGRLIEEPASKDTWDNIAFSKKLMAPDTTALIITNEFHQLRALAIARVLGVKASVYGRDPRTYSMRFFYAIRERGANVKWLLLYLGHALHIV